MDMQLEFNWYLVAQGEPVAHDDGFYNEEGLFLKTGTYYEMMKDGARIYPVGMVVPLIKDDEAEAVVYVRECSQRLGPRNENFTVIRYEVLMDLREGDPVRDHYTDMYLAYKKKQEIEDHGGRFKTQDFVNALNRRGFEFALKQKEEEQL